jgi:hypothetical protein
MKIRTAIVALALLAVTGLVVVLTRHQPQPNAQPPVTPEVQAALPAQQNPPAQRPPELPLPPEEKAARYARMQPIFGEAGETFAVRFQAVHAMKGPLSRTQVETLYSFLRTSGAKRGTTEAGEHVLKNDVMDLLCREKVLPPDLLSNLCALAREQQQDEVTRDYAVQHVVSLCLKSAEQFETDRPAARETLWDALSDTGSLPGTAILGLHRLSATDAGLDAAQVSDAALKLALQPGADELVRLTALQVCAERQLKEILPEATRLAKGAGNLPLRLSAIAALGSAGGKPEKELLETLRSGGEKPLQPAVESALRRLNARLQTDQHKI